MDKGWTVYCHKNKINGKLYIGTTSQTMAQRCRNDGSGYKTCPRFWKAIQKHGWDNFEHIIIAENLNEKEAKGIESHLIAKYDTVNDEYGYNITLGGDGTRGVIITEQTKEAIRKANSKSVCQFDLDMKFIAKYKSIIDAETASGVLHNNISACCLHRNGYFTSGGYIWLYESELDTVNKEDILFKIKHKRSTPIMQFTAKMEFIKEYTSVEEASMAVGVSCTRIRNCASQANKYTAKGYLWIYKKDYLKMLSGEIPMRQPYTNPHFRAVKQYTKDMKCIGEYESIKSAAEQTGVGAGCILDACKGRHKTAYGYIWKYKEAV